LEIAAKQSCRVETAPKDSFIGNPHLVEVEGSPGTKSSDSLLFLLCTYAASVLFFFLKKQFLILFESIHKAFIPLPQGIYKACLAQRREGNL
jgi:hypothetical protein